MNEWKGQAWLFHIYGKSYCWKGCVLNLHAPWAQPQNILKWLNYQPPGQQDNELWHYCVPLWESPPSPQAPPDSSGCDCAGAAAQSHNSRSKVSPGKKWFPPPHHRPFVSPAEAAKTAVWRETFLPFQETLTVVVETKKPQHLAKGMAKQTPWGNPSVKFRPRSKDSYKYLIDFITLNFSVCPLPSEIIKDVCTVLVSLLLKAIKFRFVH